MTLVTDVLMISYKSPEYVRISIPHLLSTCDEHTRVWLWQNGDDEETLAAVSEFAQDPRVHRFHHSRENVRLTKPTNWLWSESDADFVSKVDDDCLPEHGWIQKLRGAHEANPEFGAIGCWRFLEEDFVPELANKKVAEYAGGHTLMRNHWVQGSGYLLPRSMVQRQGLLVEGKSFPSYCIDLARKGAVNGWPFPFVREDNMDDPRSPNTLFKNDDDFVRRMPLTAQYLGIRTVEGWARQEHESAIAVQKASLDIRQYYGWRRKRHNIKHRLERLLFRKAW